MGAADLRPHICFRRGLYVRVAELENDLRIADGKAVLVGNSPSQDQGIVVEPEVLGVDKQDFADL